MPEKLFECLSRMDDDPIDDKYIIFVVIDK